MCEGEVCRWKAAGSSPDHGSLWNPGGGFQRLVRSISLRLVSVRFTVTNTSRASLLSTCTSFFLVYSTNQPIPKAPLSLRSYVWYPTSGLGDVIPSRLFLQNNNTRMHLPDRPASSQTLNIFAAKKPSWSSRDRWLALHRALNPIPKVWILILEQLLSASASLTALHRTFTPLMGRESNVEYIYMQRAQCSASVFTLKDCWDYKRKIEELQQIRFSFTQRLSDCMLYAFKATISKANTHNCIPGHFFIMIIGKQMDSFARCASEVRLVLFWWCWGKMWE